MGTIYRSLARAGRSRYNENCNPQKETPCRFTIGRGYRLGCSITFTSGGLWQSAMP